MGRLKYSATHGMAQNFAGGLPESLMSRAMRKFRGEVFVRVIKKPSAGNFIPKEYRPNGRI